MTEVVLFVASRFAITPLLKGFVDLMMERGRFVVLFALAVVAAATIWATIMEPADRSGRVQVIDGDELIIDGTHVHLENIDAFDLGQLCRAGTVVVDCGLEAKKALEEMIDGKAALCLVRNERDPPYRPKNALCSLVLWQNDAERSSEKTPDPPDLSERMIRQGWALVRPDRAKDKTESLCKLEAEAKGLRRGAWAYQFVLPAAARGEALNAERTSCGNERRVGP